MRVQHPFLKIQKMAHSWKKSQIRSKREEGIRSWFACNFGKWANGPTWCWDTCCCPTPRSAPSAGQCCRTAGPATTTLNDSFFKDTDSVTEENPRIGISVVRLQERFESVEILMFPNKISCFLDVKTCLESSSELPTFIFLLHPLAHLSSLFPLMFPLLSEFKQIWLSSLQVFTD